MYDRIEAADASQALADLCQTPRLQKIATFMGGKVFRFSGTPLDNAPSSLKTVSRISIRFPNVSTMILTLSPLSDFDVEKPQKREYRYLTTRYVDGHTDIDVSALEHALDADSENGQDSGKNAVATVAVFPLERGRDQSAGVEIKIAIMRIEGLDNKKQEDYDAGIDHRRTDTVR